MQSAQVSCRRRLPPRRLVRLAAPYLLGAALHLGGPVPAALPQPTYTLDEDPIRIGRKAYQEGRLDEARDAFEDALAASYQVHRAAYGLGLIAVRQGRYEEGLERLGEAVEWGEPDSRHRFPEARAELGLLYLRVGKPAEATVHIEAALAAQPDLWSAVFGRAGLLMAEGKWEEAESLLERGARKQGVGEGEDRYHYGKARCRMQDGDLGAAERHALLALYLDPGEPQYAMLVGEIYARQGTAALAIQAFETALARPGTVPTAPFLHRLGRLYEDSARYTDARDRYLEAVEVDSAYAPALRDLAGLLRRGHQNDTAARVYLRYLALEPGDVDARLEFCGALLDSRRIEECLGAAGSALAIDSTRADVRAAYVRCGIRSRDPAARAEALRLADTLPDSAAWGTEDLVLLAGLALDAGRLERAAGLLSRGLEQAPEDPGVRFQSGVLALKQGDPEAAVSSLELAVALDPDNTLYHMNLAVALLQVRRVGEAIVSLRRALSLDPDLTVAHLYLAQALASSDSLGAAETEYRRVLDAEPDNTRALRGLGYCAIQRGDYREAASAYEQAAKADPGDAEAWAGLGSAKLGLQDWPAAEDAFRRARAIDPGNRTALRGMELLERARKGSP